METVLSILVGAAITWVCSWWYYKKAGDELKEISIELKKEVKWIQMFNENQLSNPTSKRNPDGEIEGMTVDMKASSKSKLSSSAELSTAKKDI